MMSSSHEVTQSLRAWSDGGGEALARLAPLVEAEMHRLAGSFLRRERPGHNLQTTALVNEAYLVELKFFGGMQKEAIAEVLKISVAHRATRMESRARLVV